MSTRLLMAVLILAAIANPTGRVQAQTPDDGRLSWDLSVREAESLGNPARTFRSYAETEQLQLMLFVLNSSEAPIVIDQEVVQNAFEVRVVGTTDIPVTVEWLPGSVAG